MGPGWRPVGRNAEFLLTDEAGDFCPRAPQPMQEADPAMPEVVRVEHGAPRRAARSASRHGHFLSPRRIAAVIALALLAVSFRRHLRFARDVFRHRRRLKLAFTVLLLVRQLRKT